MTLPTAITLTRDFNISDKTPLKTLLKFDTTSAKPSTAPIRVLLNPSSECKNTGSNEKTMHVELVHKNPQVANAQMLKLSTAFETIFGSFFLRIPGSRHIKYWTNPAPTPIFFRPISSSSISS